METFVSHTKQKVRIMSQWQIIASTSDVSPDEPLGVKVEDKNYGLYELEGNYYVLDDICPHAHALLTQGFVDDGEVECPLHNAVFQIKTGKCLSGPATDVKTYEVQVKDGQISAQL